MFLIVTNELSKSEQYIMDLLMKKLGIYHYGVYQLKHDQPMSLDAVMSHKLIIVQDQTAGKSAFDKNLEKIYGKEDTVRIKESAVRISRPSTFSKTKESKEEVWTQLRDWSLQQKISVMKIDMDKIHSKLPKDLVEQLLLGGQRSVYNLQDKTGASIEIRPDELKPTISNSITYSEFLVLVTSRYIFNFDKFIIKKTAA